MRSRIYLITGILLTLLVYSVYTQAKQTNELIYEADSQTDPETPFIKAISDDYIAWMNFEVTLHEIESETQAIIPKPCEFWNPESGDLVNNWLTIHSSCSEDFILEWHSFLYNLESKSYTRLTDLSTYESLPISFRAKTDGSYVLWLQQDFREWYPNFSQSIAHILDLSTNEVTEFPSIADGRVLRARITSPWIISQGHETDSPDADIITSAYNFETGEQYEINRHFYLDYTIAKENHVIWTDVNTNDIYHHNLMTGNTKLIIPNKFDHQLAWDVSRSIVYLTVDPIVNRDPNETQTVSEGKGLFNHTQVYSFNLETEEMKLLYENPDAYSMGPVLSSGDQLTWGEEVHLSPSHFLNRVYYRNLTPYKSFFPFVSP